MDEADHRTDWLGAWVRAALEAFLRRVAAGFLALSDEDRVPQVLLTGGVR